LVLPRHWKKNIGRLVKITPTQGEKYIARIQSFADNKVTLESKNESSVISLSDIAKAQIEVEFNRKEVK
jgi:ribosome maturation factor RimP